MEDAEIRERLKRGSGYADLPGRFISPNQVVAWNLAYFRKATGLTQDELGDRLGWSKAIVSAAERSWDSKRSRQFSADDILALAMALGLPIVALFLPPDDDGVQVRYEMNMPVGRWPDGRPAHKCMTMHDLMLFVVPEADEYETAEDTDEPRGDIGRRFWNRYVSAINGYLRGEEVGELVDYMDDVGTEEQIVQHLARLRGQCDALRDLISDNDHLQAALVKRLSTVREDHHPEPEPGSAS